MFINGFINPPISCGWNVDNCNTWECVKTIHKLTTLRTQSSQQDSVIFINNPILLFELYNFSARMQHGGVIASTERLPDLGQTVARQLLC